MAANPVPPAPELHIDTEKTPTETIFHCTGQIASSTTHLLQSAVRSEISRNKTVVLNLSGVSSMDSSGLGAIVGLWVSAKKVGCELKLVSLSERVKELLHLTRLDQLFAASRFPDTPSF
jgi:anti-anti-sigma factor